MDSDIYEVITFSNLKDKTEEYQKFYINEDLSISEKVTYILKKGYDSQRSHLLSNINLYKEDEQAVQVIINEIDDNLETYNQFEAELLVNSVSNIFASKKVGHFEKHYKKLILRLYKSLVSEKNIAESILLKFFKHIFDYFEEKQKFIVISKEFCQTIIDLGNFGQNANNRRLSVFFCRKLIPINDKSNNEELISRLVRLKNDADPNVRLEISKSFNLLYKHSKNESSITNNYFNKEILPIVKHYIEKEEKLYVLYFSIKLGLKIPELESICIERLENLTKDEISISNENNGNKDVVDLNSNENSYKYQLKVNTLPSNDSNQKLLLDFLVKVLKKNDNYKNQKMQNVKMNVVNNFLKPGFLLADFLNNLEMYYENIVMSDAELNKEFMFWLKVQDSSLNDKRENKKDSFTHNSTSNLPSSFIVNPMSHKRNSVSNLGTLKSYNSLKDVKNESNQVGLMIQSYGISNENKSLIFLNICKIMSLYSKIDKFNYLFQKLISDMFVSLNTILNDSEPDFNILNNINKSDDTKTTLNSSSDLSFISISSTSSLNTNNNKFISLCLDKKNQELTFSGNPIKTFKHIYNIINTSRIKENQVTIQSFIDNFEYIEYFYKKKFWRVNKIITDILLFDIFYTFEGFLERVIKLIKEFYMESEVELMNNQILNCHISLTVNILKFCCSHDYDDLFPYIEIFFMRSNYFIKKHIFNFFKLFIEKYSVYYFVKTSFFNTLKEFIKIDNLIYVEMTIYFLKTFSPIFMYHVEIEKCINSELEKFEIALEQKIKVEKIKNKQYQKGLSLIQDYQKFIFNLDNNDNYALYVSDKDLGTIFESDLDDRNCKYLVNKQSSETNYFKYPISEKKAKKLDSINIVPKEPTKSKSNKNSFKKSTNLTLKKNYDKIRPFSPIEKLDKEKLNKDDRIDKQDKTDRLNPIVLFESNVKMNITSKIFKNNNSNINSNSNKSNSNIISTSFKTQIKSTNNLIKSDLLPLTRKTSMVAISKKTSLPEINKKEKYK